MDTFIDKLAQKFTAQEIIKANTAAEAAELQHTREQVKKYEAAMQENKQATETTREAIRQLEQTINTSVDHFTAGNALLEEQITDFVHKENVKVYRNVQASMVDELAKQTEELSSKLEQVTRKNKSIMGVAVASLIFSILSTGALVYLVLLSLGIIAF